ncbi:MAG: lipid II flippase MurJ [Kiritimatiellia bacterium]
MIFRIQSFKQAAFWSTAINAFGQGLSLVFSMVMAATFGAQESTDVLYYCIGVFALLSGMFQAVNVSVLVPETMRRRHQVGEGDAMAFINRFFAVFALLILGLTAWILWNPAGTMTLISRFSAEALERNSRLVFWLLATLPLQMAAQLLLDVLVSYKFLSLPAALSCVNRSLNIGFVLLFHRQLGVISVALGMLLGYGLQVLLNLYLLGRVIHWRPFAWKTRIGGAVFRNIAWTEIGTLAGTLAGYLPLFLFSGFGAGVMTAMNYARRLAAIPADLLTTQVSGVMAIKFNELAARREQGSLAEAYGRMSRLLVFILVPLSALLALVGPDVVAILFGRGAFRESGAVALTSNLLSLLALNIPLTGMMMFMARFFVAHQAIRYGTVWQIFSALLNAGMVAWWVRWLGAIGLPIGLILHMFLYLAILSVSMARRFPGLALGPVWRALFLDGAASAIVALPLWMARMRWGAGISPWALGAGTVWLFAAGYGLLLFVLPPDRLAWQYFKDTARAAGARLRGGPRIDASGG